MRPVIDYEAAGSGAHANAAGPAVAAGRAVDRLFREESGRAVAALIRVLGDFDLAEEAVQDAFLVALEVWPERGLPRNPERGSRPRPATRPSTASDGPVGSRTGARAGGARAPGRGGRDRR